MNIFKKLRFWESGFEIIKTEKQFFQESGSRNGFLKRKSKLQKLARKVQRGNKSAKSKLIRLCKKVG